MKFSEAIREGAKLDIPNMQGAFFGFKDGDGDLCACAAGKALIAIGALSVDSAIEMVKDAVDNGWSLNAHVSGSGVIPSEWVKSHEAIPDYCTTPLGFVACLNDKEDYTELEIAEKLAELGL